MIAAYGLSFSLIRVQGLCSFIMTFSVGGRGFPYYRGGSYCGYCYICILRGGLGEYYLQDLLVPINPDTRTQYIKHNHVHRASVNSSDVISVLQTQTMVSIKWFLARFSFFILSTNVGEINGKEMYERPPALGI